MSYNLGASPEMVWLKAVYVCPENEARGFRKDRYGNWIRKYDYGRRNMPYGWEMDHTFPKSFGGLGTLGNLEPVHWQANVRKSNSLLPSLLDSLTKLNPL